jgi:hypothetical protein
MLDTAKNMEVTLLYWMRVGGFILCKKMAGESLLGLGKDRIVRLARRSFVKSWRPRFPSVAPPFSPKIDVGTSTLSPVVGSAYLCHSKFAAVAGNVDTRMSKKES